MTATEFEKLTQKLFAERLKGEFGFDIPVDHLRKFTSTSGNSYKMDLSYSFKILDMTYLTLVECKYWKSSVTREKVGYFKSIMDELKAQKGIIVTTKGFQSGAVTYAQTQNIGLVKITNDMYFEEWAHFDGALDLLSDKINKGKPFLPNEKYTSIGLFTAQTPLSDFIAKKYGDNVIKFLENDFDPGDLDDPNFDLSSELKQQLLNIPDNWYEDYVRSETAGLHYKMKNEPELRILNMTLLMLKWALQNNRQ